MGQYGAWGRYVDGCTVSVRCYFTEGLPGAGRSIIRTVAFKAIVTLNSRLRILDSLDAGTGAGRACDWTNFGMPATRTRSSRTRASRRCSATACASPPRNCARIQCRIHVSRGAPAQPCPGAFAPVDGLSDQAAEAAVLYSPTASAASTACPGCSRTRTRRGRAATPPTPSPTRVDGRSPHDNPYTGTKPADRIVAAGYCPAAKYPNLDWPENAYTASVSGHRRVALDARRCRRLVDEPPHRRGAPGGRRTAIARRSSTRTRSRSATASCSGLGAGRPRRQGRHVRADVRDLHRLAPVRDAPDRRATAAPVPRREPGGADLGRTRCCR